MTKSDVAKEGKAARIWSPAIASVITWLATSAGLTGILVTVGYIVHSAHANFLGMAVHGLTATEYLRIAGAFLLAIILQYVSFAGDLWSLATSRWTLTALALTVTVAIALALRYRRRARRIRDRLSEYLVVLRRPRIGTLGVLALLFAVTKTVYFDLPANG